MDDRSANEAGSSRGSIVKEPAGNGHSLGRQSNAIYERWRCCWQGGEREREDCIIGTEKHHLTDVYEHYAAGEPLELAPVCFNAAHHTCENAAATGRI